MGTLVTQCSPDAPTTLVLTMTSLTSTWHCRRLRTQRRVLRAGIVSTGGQITSRKFPNLARTARQYFGVPATSATVERLFSVVGFAFADRRNEQAPSRWPTSSPSLSSICLYL